MPSHTSSDRPNTLITTAQLEALLRGETGDTRSYFDTLQAEATISGAHTVVRWHRIAHDATRNQPDTEKLLDKLFCLLIDFACTRKELAEALALVQSSGSAEALAKLHEKARRLFTTGSTTGEIGELLLYFLAEHVLKYPQVLCKFPLKTNPNVHAHGADGIHASIDPATGHLRLHWGEAKLYKSLVSALEDCFVALSELILEPPDATKSKRRDVELLRDNMALNDPAIELAIRDYLDPDNVLSNKVRYCGLALVGFDLEDYDALTQEVANKQMQAVKTRIEDWTAKIKASVEKHELLGITVDVFCIPLPSVQKFRDAFLRRLS